MKKKRKYSLGGDLLQTGVSFIPGVGQILSPLIGLIDEQVDQDALQALRPPEPMKMNQNPFGRLSKGGNILNDTFKQYSTGSHQTGNDLSVDVRGIPDSNGENSVQNKENSYKIGNEQYVFSDVLKKEGIPFNKIAMKINKKYPKARFIPDQKNALDLEMKLLSKDNDLARMKSSNQKAYGGILDNGDPEVPPSNNLQWNAQSLYPITIPTLFPQAVNSMGITKFQPRQDAGIAPNIQQVNAEAATLFGTNEMDANNITGDGTLAQDTTTFGQELNPIGVNLSDPNTVATDRGNPITATGKTVGNGILDPKTANTIGLISKGLGLAGSINDALTPAENEKLILPDYN